MTVNKIENDLLWINQSKVKRLTSSVICPQRYYLEDVTGELKREASEPMNRGQYFEYKLWGTLPKEGNIPVLGGGKKKGSISVAQQRIDQQIELFPELMKKYGIKVIKTNVRIEIPFNHEIIVFGTKDALVEYKGKPYVFDLKLTADVNSKFGAFAWGNFQTIKRAIPGTPGIYSDVQTLSDNSSEMDLIQAHTYMYTLEQKTKAKWGFLYGVFDYKPTPGPEHKIIEVEFSKEAREKMIERLSSTKHKLKIFAQTNYAPIPSVVECKTCKNVGCTERMTIEELIVQPEPITSPVQAKAEPVEDDSDPF
jgi:hypothetical protein